MKLLLVLFLAILGLCNENSTDEVYESDSCEFDGGIIWLMLAVFIMFVVFCGFLVYMVKVIISHAMSDE